MEIFLVIIIGALAIFIFAKSIGRRGERTQLLEKFVASLNHEEAQQEFEKSFGIVATQMSDPVSSDIKKQDADLHLERAVACKNRMNEIEGLEHGPSFRLRYRFELLGLLKRTAGI